MSSICPAGSSSLQQPWTHLEGDEKNFPFSFPRNAFRGGPFGLQCLHVGSGYQGTEGEALGFPSKSEIWTLSAWRGEPALSALSSEVRPINWQRITLGRGLAGLQPLSNCNGETGNAPAAQLGQGQPVGTGVYVHGPHWLLCSLAA